MHGVAETSRDAALAERISPAQARRATPALSAAGPQSGKVRVDSSESTLFSSV